MCLGRLRLYGIKEGRIHPECRMKSYSLTSPLLRILFPFSIAPGVQGGHEASFVFLDLEHVTQTLWLNKPCPPLLRGRSKGLGVWPGTFLSEATGLRSRHPQATF